ncbi:hypothetical protein SH601_14575 [Gracilibacillus sp. S3-1-1]|uniref:Uncharacterized protein n=1 Tax=Gracilibacillus pellucidus TaxID=3095368 RepID=A0ACC6M8F5_9BACI|nr:hypothetical protein [Gracilibacillus sp. S3-1-1]MDX8047210.1 hypothetical protein [Gracilibacillus sp. S3-1-1]
MNATEYINTNFPGLVLAPSLYMQWDVKLHFELGSEMHPLHAVDSINHAYFTKVYSQCLSIFDDLFSEQDDINVRGKRLSSQKGQNAKQDEFV